ncbi:MAG: hypothetical protein ACNS63_02745 [Candidatus Nitrospinota bacterium M3_3B_026]
MKVFAIRRLAMLALAVLLSAAAAPEAAALDLGMLKLHGYMDMRYTQATKDEGSEYPQATGMDNGSFNLLHFNLLMDVVIRPDLLIQSMVEFEHGPDTGRGHGSVILEYAFADYILANWLKLRGGKTLTPWGLYNEIHDASPAFLSVNVPEMMYHADSKGGFPLIPKFTTGLALRGEVPTPGHHDIDYVLYAGNGEGLGSTNEAAFDDNVNKAAGGRLQFTTHDESIQAGLSGFYGERAVTPDNLNEWHWASVASLNVNLGRLNVRGEYGQSELGDRGEITWYAQGSYRAGRYTPYLRYQTIDPDTDFGDDDWTSYLAGVNVRMNDNLFIKVEWNENRRGANNVEIINEGGEDFGQFRAAFTLFF